MPLPAALAARLAKRGLITKEKLEEAKEASREEEEEVFAESYDDTSGVYNPSAQSYSPLHSDDETENVEAQISLKFKGHPGCPNKSSIFHECSKYCKLRWKDGIRVPSKEYLNRKIRMLSKYPLPDGWKEVYDPGYGRHYYWDTTTDSVSWLPPNHPKAIITEPAAVLKEEQHLAAGDKESSSEDSDEEGEEEDGETKTEKEIPNENKERSERAEREKERPNQKKNQRGNKRQQNDLDPMDPASYSDIPRGGWSDGLQADTKSGVDSTASGPLFQMRPYPSPGAILRANAASKKKKVDSEESP